MKQAINTNKSPQAIGPYSQAIVSGNFVFTSGQIPLTPEGNLVIGTIEEKMHQVMKNLDAILCASGVTFANVVKTTIYLTDVSFFNRINMVYKQYMKEPYPARETVIVKELPKGADIEVSLIALKR
jgi:2-iminobutanoate/2-iminopropanoate deaminase